MLKNQPLSSKNLFNLYSNESDQKDNFNQSKSTTTKKVTKKNVVPEDSESQKLMKNLKMMDIFQMGMAILEVLNNGKSFMSYADLVKKKKEGIDFSQIITQSVSKLSKQYHPLADLLKDLLK